MRRLASKLLLILALAFAGGTARADDSVKGNGNGNGNGGNNGGKNPPGKVEKPERPSNGGNGSSGNKDTKNDLKAEFKAQAEALQKKQKDLLGQLKNANAEERAKIREQLVTLKDNWKELNREFRDKLDDLKGKIDRENIKEERGGGKPRK